MEQSKEQAIYKLMNAATVDLEEYEEEKLTEIERKKMKKKIKSSLNQGVNKRNTSKRGVLVAATLLVCVGVIGSKPVQGAIQLLSYNIAQGLGIERDLASYTEVINKAITKKGVTIQLNEVILNNDEMIVSYTTQVDEKLENGWTHTTVDIFINGKECAISGGGGSEQIDEYTVTDVMTYQLDESVKEQLEGDLDIKIIMKDVLTQSKEYKDEWVFEFSVNGDELRADTKVMPLEYAFTLENGESVQLLQYTQNDIGDKIYYSRGEGQISYDLALRGTDDVGSEISFYLSHESKGKGVLELNTVMGEPIAEGATSLSLTPYAVKFPETSGKMSDDFQPVGEAFNIDLTLLQNK